MKRIKILLIAYYFPPLGGAGVSRPLSLFKKLPQFDIDVDVLTVKNISYRTYEPELLENLDTDRIYRTGSLDPQRILYLLGMRKIKEKTISKGRSLIDSFFPDSKIGWVKQALKTGRVLVENKQYDAIISTSPPISTHLVAKKLSKEFSIPYIADFRDFWTSYKPKDWYSDRRKIEKATKLLKDIRTSASKVVSVSEPIQKYLQTGEIIYNSYDEERAQLWKAPPESDSYYIGVLGTLDKLCPIEPLCMLLDKLRNTNQDIFKKIKVLQVGNINDISFYDTLNKYNLTDVFEIHNQQNRKETIDILNNTSMLYMGLNPKFEEGIVTTRLFDMLASGRAVLASVTENSEVAKILKNFPDSFCYTPDNFQSAIEYLITQINTNQKKIIPIVEQLMPYSSHTMAEKYSVIIKDIVHNKKRL